MGNPQKGQGKVKQAFSVRRAARRSAGGEHLDRLPVHLAEQGVGEHLGGRPVRRDRTAAQHHGPVGVRGGEPQIVQHHDHRVSGCRPFAADPQHQFLVAEVQGGRRLAVALLAVLLGALLPATAAHAANRTVQGGRLDRGIKSSVSKDRGSGRVTTSAQVPLATLGLSGIDMTGGSTPVALDNAPATLTTDGAEAFGSLYRAGTATDPVSLAVAVDAKAQLPALPDLGSRAELSRTPSARPAGTPASRPAAAGSGSRTALAVGGGAVLLAAVAAGLLVARRRRTANNS